jgi:hypothetical protein
MYNLLADPEWISTFRRLVDELLSAARDLERFPGMPSYHNTILSSRWRPYHKKLATHLWRAADASAKGSGSGAVDKDLWEAYQLAYAMMDDIATKSQVNPDVTSSLIMALKRVKKLLARSKAASAPPPAQPEAAEGETPFDRTLSVLKRSPKGKNLVKFLFEQAHRKATLRSVTRHLYSKGREPTIPQQEKARQLIRRTAKTLSQSRRKGLLRIEWDWDRDEIALLEPK